REAARWQPTAREGQIDGEYAESDRAEGHQPNLDLVPGKSLAQERSHAGAHREDGEEQRCHVLVATQNVLGEGRELGEIGRTVEPEPGDAQHRQPDDAIAVSEPEVASGLGERIPVDLELRSDRGRQRYAAAHDVSGD